MSDSGKPPNLNREAIRKRIGALPPTSGASIEPITQKAALAAFFDLESRGSAIPEQVKQHESAIYQEILSKLEPIPGHRGHYVITADMLRGLIKRVGHTVSAQATLEVGQRLLQKKHQHHELTYLKRLLVGKKTVKRQIEPDPDNAAEPL